MIARSLIRSLRDNLGTVINIRGWVQTIRNQKKVQFLVVRDHTGMIQAVHERGGLDDNLATIIDDLTAESAVEVIGKVIANEKVKLGQVEIILEDIKVLNKSEPQIPINENSALDVRLDWRFLDLRLPKNYLLFQVQTIAEQAMREYWRKNEFIEIHSPKFMASPSESGAELFRVEYFDRSAYLAQSPQFYKQMAMSAGFDKVFEVGPVFRANPSFTSRHDTEFTSVDVEMSWIDSHEDVMRLEEEWLQSVLQVIHDQLGDAIEQTFGTKVTVPEAPFPRVTMSEAHSILAEYNHAPPADGKGDLDPEGERILARHIQAKYGHEFVFVTDYPIAVRPFYHMRSDANPNVTKSFDLIWKGLEVTTGAQREHRYDVLVRQVQEKGLSLEPIRYYLDCFKYGCPPHGGFGFGLTRMLMVLLGLNNVREVTYLYRGPNRLSP